MRIGYADKAIFEQKFWLQIMGDHARFIYYSLAGSEKGALEEAGQYMAIYDQLLQMARKPLPEPEIIDLNDAAVKNTYDFREFKLRLLSLTLESKLKVNLSSTFFNHMVNELDEYLLIMNGLIKGDDIVYHPLHYNLLWLSDAAGHAAGISSSLDEAEKDYIYKSGEYEKQFTHLFMKSVNFEGYLRTKMGTFPALDRLNSQAASVMSGFKEFLEDIRNERISAKPLGTLTPLMADHMAREECYYLLKLSESAKGIAKPECDPTRKRVEG